LDPNSVIGVIVQPESGGGRFFKKKKKKKQKKKKKKKQGHPVYKKLTDHKTPVSKTIR